MFQVMDFLPPLDSPCPGGQRNNHVISFRHLAYPRTERELLRFNALDGLDKDGFDFDLALISCSIVTGNTWKAGWLATSDNLEQFVRVERPDDNILRSQTYYYFVGDHEPTYKYPVVPSFHYWQFPHGELPDLRADIDILPDAESQITRRDEAVLSRDATCRITACKGAREVAHLVPAGELYWFGRGNKTGNYQGHYQARLLCRTVTSSYLCQGHIYEPIRTIVYKFTVINNVHGYTSTNCQHRPYRAGYRNSP